MSLLIPLGLLGLLSVIALILIYIIKPNYQQKRISSTYVWKLSLKYKKKRIPISRLSQIILFICQLLILVLCALLLTKPAILEERIDYKAESVVIIDASASMMVSEGGESRFDKAVEKVKDFAENTVANDGVLSIILAGYNAEFVVQRSSASDALVISDSIAELQAAGTDKCTFGSADIDGAVALAEQVLEINSKADVYLYTATEYINKNGIKVEKIMLGDEWNAAVLDCTAKLGDDNYYSISIDVGCYRQSANITVYCDIFGVNDTDRTVQVRGTEFFDNTEEEKTFNFTSSDFQGGAIYSFEYLHIYINESDSFAHDNNYYYYGGKREKIKIQYASSASNTFFRTTCATWRSELKDYWDIEYKVLGAKEKPELKGFDIYIFEDVMPDELPTDGLIILSNPDKAPLNSGLRFGNTINVSSDSSLALGAEHPITKYVDADNITVSTYKKVIEADGYEDLLYYGNDPIMLVKNQRNSKIVVFTGAINFSSIGMVKEMPIMMYQLYAYFLPSTIKDYAFEIGQTVTVNARGENLNLTAPNADKPVYFDELPAEYRVDRPGTYTLTQTGLGNKEIIQSFFVKVPNFESNITKEVAALPILHTTSKQEYADKDLMVYFAAALFAIIFIEWLLQAREYFR